jgi:bifunctional UDP-N-acetylglucosamine pyrophosphorylase/glucosamine-1-phosphate N-acetyltransferase
MNNNFSIVILAAGLGKRMQNAEIPKVLAQLKSNPLLYYVLQTGVNLSPQKICIVVGHKKELIIDYVNNKFIPENCNAKKPDTANFIDFAVQSEQLGTGHAVKCTENYFKDYDGKILILSGDVPLLKAHTLKEFIKKSDGSNIAVLTAIASNPFGYGRIIRDENQNIISIIEEKDASEEQKLINEINSGIYFVETKILFSLLNEIKNNNSQNEFYLTDIISLGLNKKQKVFANTTAPLNEILGVNTAEQLTELEEYL